MKSSILILLLIIMGFSVFSCSSSDSTINDKGSYLQSGYFYHFQMLDSNNLPLVDGKMKISYKKNLNISGTYELLKIYNDTIEGINTMKGTFSGKENKDNKSVYMNMNPKISDNNIIFDFTVQNNKIQGKWYHSTMLGKKTEGYLTGYKSDK